MGRTAIVFDKSELLKALQEVESGGPLENRSVLFASLASKLKVSNSTVLNKMKELDLIEKIQTPLGKRSAGVPISEEQKLAMKAGRVNKEVSANDENSFKDLAKVCGPKLASKVEAVRNGSRRNAIALKCIDCCGSVDETGKLPVQDIKLCPCTDCALWTLRPYK